MLIYGGLAYAGWRVLRTNYVRDFWNKCFKLFFETKYFDTIIDLGCGDGAYAHYLKKHADMVIGVDIDSVSLNFCRYRYDRVVKADVSKVKLPYNCAVFSNQTLEHLSPEDGMNMMREIQMKSQFAVIGLPLKPFVSNIVSYHFPIVVYNAFVAPQTTYHHHRTMWSPEIFKNFGFKSYIIKDNIVAVFERGGYNA